MTTTTLTTAIDPSYRHPVWLNSILRTIRIVGRSYHTAMQQSARSGITRQD